MNSFLRHSTCVLVLFLPVALQAKGDVERGEYLTTILGCGGCHTEGALLGQQSGPWLAGSKVGIAYSDYEEGDHPSIVFPANLTDDRATGLGRWSEKEIARAIRTGMGHSRDILIPVMPWPNYSLLTDDDARAIAAYLKSLPAVERPIPDNISAGTVSTEPYVRVGVFIFDPDARAPEPPGTAPDESSPGE